VASPSAAGDWFAVVDTAQDPRLIELVKASARQQCLVSGAVAPVLAATLPYVVLMKTGEPLADAWRAHGAGRNWGIMLQSGLPIDQLRIHFKKFINAKLPDGTVALFRFYDPRVFRTYIRAATAEERAPWFAGIARFSVEAEEPGRFHDFQLLNGQLYDGPMQVEG
jgi:hypothetical protein